MITNFFWPRLINFNLSQFVKNEGVELQRSFWTKILGALPILGIVLLIYILSRFDLAAILITALNIDLTYLLFACLIFIANLCMKSWRWQKVLQLLSIRLPFKLVLTYYLSATFYGTVTFGRIGEVYKMRLLTDRNFNRVEAFLCASLDRLIDIIFLITFASLYFLLNLPSERVNPLLLFILAGGFTFFFFWGISYFQQNIDNWLNKKVTNHKFRQLLQSATQVLKPIKQGSRFLEVIFLTLTSWGLYGYFGFILAQGLQIDISFWPVVFAMLAAIVISLIPVTIHGFGTRELVFIQVATVYRFSSELALSLSIISVCTMILISILFGGLGLSYESFFLGKKNLSPTDSGVN